MNLPKHLMLIISHNDHKSCYEDMSSYLNFEPMNRIENLTPEEIKICIENNEIWEIQWYPETPIGFHYVCAPTLEGCLEKINAQDWE